MHITGLDAENIPRKIERSDLAATVIQHPVGANGTGNHLVEKLRRLLFAVNLAVAGKPKGSAHQTQWPFIGCSDASGSTGTVGS